MRRHALAAGLMLLAALALLTPACRAEESAAPPLIEQEVERLIDGMDLDGIQRSVPEIDVPGLLRRAAAGETPWDGEALAGAVRAALTGELANLAPLMLRAMGASVLCAALTQLGASAQGGAARLCQTIAYLCLALPLAWNLTELIGEGRAVTGRMTDFYQAVLPTMLALLSAMGGARSAAQMQGLSLAVTGSLAGFVQGALFTALTLSLAMTCMRHFAPEIHLGRACRLLREGVHWALGACFTLFLGLLTVQGATAAGYDGVTLRAAKFAIDKFVPVVGGAFKDTAETLVGCSVVVKNAVGVVGLAGLASMLLAPLGRILATLGAYRLCAAALEPLGDARLAPALGDFADILSTLFILMISVGAMFFVFLAALMRMGMGFV